MAEAWNIPNRSRPLAEAWNIPNRSRPLAEAWNIPRTCRLSRDAWGRFTLGVPPFASALDALKIPSKGRLTSPRARVCFFYVFVVVRIRSYRRTSPRSPFLWMLRVIVWMLRATVRMLRATVWMLRETVWMLRAIVWMSRIKRSTRHNIGPNSGHERASVLGDDLQNLALLGDRLACELLFGVGVCAEIRDLRAASPQEIPPSVHLWRRIGRGPEYSGNIPGLGQWFSSQRASRRFGARTTPG
eukprot:8686757-Pyramimonas_sp.AAC.1